MNYMNFNDVLDFIDTNTFFESFKKVYNLIDVNSLVNDKIKITIKMKEILRMTYQMQVKKIKLNSRDISDNL